MNKPETIYLYRRKGQDAFATCDLDRYSELYGHALFETKIAYIGTPSIPEGYALVPVEPTAAMIEAAFAGKMEVQSVQHQERARATMAENYKAMLAAAQEVK